jgi:hypothetical protein
MTKRALSTCLVAVAAVAGALVIAAPGASTPSRSGCAAKPPFSVLSSRPGAHRNLVPGRPETLLLCRYDGPLGSPSAPRPPAFPLVAQLLITNRSRISALAREFNRLPKMMGAFACPLDSGAAIIARFGYSTGPNDPVRLDLGGCLMASNGRTVRGAGLNGSTILEELEALVHARAASSRRARTARISGSIRLCGGPAPGRCFASTVGGCTPGEGCATSDRVVAIDAAGRQAAAQRLRRGNGRFSLHVAPGRYVVELLADGKHVHGRLMQARGATVRAGKTTRVVFSFDVP